MDPLAPKSGLETAPPVTGPACRPADLSVVDADAIVRPDAVQTVFLLRTTGPDCRLQGYPQLTFRESGGAPLAVDVRQGGFGLKPSDGRAVALSRSTSLSFLVASGRDGSCADVGSLSVVLPGTSAPLTAPTTMRVCAGTVGITPVQRLEGDE